MTNHLKRRRGPRQPQPSTSQPLSLVAEARPSSDLDPQANSSISFLDPLGITRSAYELMMDGQN
jgi:hypothetical protein